MDKPATATAVSASMIARAWQPMNVLGCSVVTMSSPAFAPEPLRADERIVLNVGGKRFETLSSTLAAHPDTLLGAMFSSRSHGLTHPDSSGEFFFDRQVVCSRLHFTVYYVECSRQAVTLRVSCTPLQATSPGKN